MHEPAPRLDDIVDKSVLPTVFWKRVKRFVQHNYKEDRALTYKDLLDFYAIATHFGTKAICSDGIIKGICTRFPTAAGDLRDMRIPSKIGKGTVEYARDFLRVKGVLELTPLVAQPKALTDLMNYSMLYIYSRDELDAFSERNYTSTTSPVDYQTALDYYTVVLAALGNEQHLSRKNVPYNSEEDGFSGFVVPNLKPEYFKNVFCFVERALHTSGLILTRPFKIRIRSTR